MPNVPGNADVIELLELYLQTARQNDFGHVAISMVGHPNIACTDFAGEISLELSQKEALALLVGKVDRSIESWTLPPPAAAPGENLFCYNVANGPLGFDFLIWLVSVEMTRRRAAAPGPLRVGFWLGRDQDRLQQDQRQLWLDKVFRPALILIGGVEDSTAILGHRPECYTTREIVAAANQGEEVPHFSSPLAERYEAGAVTITLREAAHWQHRNSDLAAWLRFASDLRAAGERVVFIRDTAKAYEPLGDFETDPLASTDLMMRCARYQTAKANLFVSNGPGALAIFGKRPWLQFIRLEAEGSGYKPDTPSFWAKSQGIDVGSQYPWSTRTQRLVWQADTYNNISLAWAMLKANLK